MADNNTAMFLFGVREYTCICDFSVLNSSNIQVIFIQKLSFSMQSLGSGHMSSL